MLDLLDLFDPGGRTNSLLHSQLACVPLLLMAEDLGHHVLHLEAHPAELSGPELPLIHEVIIELVALFLEHLNMPSVVKAVDDFDFATHYFYKSVELLLKQGSKFSWIIHIFVELRIRLEIRNFLYWQPFHTFKI